MGRSPGGFAVLVLGVCAILSASSAAAQSLRVYPTRRVGLDYETTPGCPDRARFVSGLQKLSPSLQVPPSAVISDRVLVLKFEKHAAVYRGILRTGSVQRQVESEACADTAYALALIAAITLDPDADVARDVSAEEFSERDPATGDTRAPEGSQPTAAPQPARRPKAPISSKAANVAPLPSPLSAKREVALRVQGFAGRELLGALGWGASLGLGWLGEHSSRVSFWVDVGGLQSTRSLVGTSVQALGLALVPSACAHVLGELRPWALDVCLGAELGAVQVAARDTATFRTVRTPWHPHGKGFLGLALLYKLGDAWRIGADLQAGVGFQSDRYTVTNLEGEETARLVESRFTQRIALEAGYAF